MGVWIPGYYDGKEYVKGHIAEGTISDVVDEIQRTGKLPRPKAEAAGKATAPVAEKAPEPAIEVQKEPEAKKKSDLESRVDTLTASLEKLTKLVEAL